MLSGKAARSRTICGQAGFGQLTTHEDDEACVVSCSFGRRELSSPGSGGFTRKLASSMEQPGGRELLGVRAGTKSMPRRLVVANRHAAMSKPVAAGVLVFGGEVDFVGGIRGLVCLQEAGSVDASRRIKASSRLGRTSAHQICRPDARRFQTACLADRPRALCRLLRQACRRLL